MDLWLDTQNRLVLAFLHLDVRSPPDFRLLPRRGAEAARLYDPCQARAAARGPQPLIAHAPSAGGSGSRHAADGPRSQFDADWGCLGAFSSTRSRGPQRKLYLMQIPLQSIVWLWVIPIASTLTPGVQLAEIQSCSYLAQPDASLSSSLRFSPLFLNVLPSPDS